MLEFSAIMSAVRPRARTDQYKVLAALYFLGAHSVPVTAKRIGDLLKLHLGKDAPSNVNASLRSYKSFVEVADKGPPLWWSLTTKGVDQLRKLSGLRLATTTTESDFQTDIAFLCALQHPEFDALVQALGGSDKWQDAGEGRFSHLFRATELITHTNKRLRVIGTVATSMGLTAAAIATTHLVLHFRPRIVVMVGIAAGTRSGHKQFGDVLVADPSVDYNSGKVVQPDPYPICLNARLRSVLHKYGVYRACSEAPEPKPRFVSFKSVCDFAADKTDSWQDYASFTAAQFAVEFLRREWDALWPAV
jgi:nucleoside phosphorylase